MIPGNETRMKLGKMLTSEQVSALTMLRGMTGASRACLIGAAGTGKTHTLRAWYAAMTPEERRATCFLAPTHKALGVLRDAVGGEGSFKTVDSFLGYALVTHPQTLKEQFLPRGEWVVVNAFGKRMPRDVPVTSSTRWAYNRKPRPSSETFAVLVVDEASMLSWDKGEEILREAEGANVVFAGDRYQLPPVNARPFLPRDYPTVELTTQMRTGRDDLANLFRVLRETVDTGVLPKIESSENVAVGPIEISADTACPVLTWTNVKVDRYNRSLRLAKLGEDRVGMRYAAGDRLMAVRPCYATDDASLVLKKVYDTGSVLEVESAYTSTYTLRTPNGPIGPFVVWYIRSTDGVTSMVADPECAEYRDVMRGLYGRAKRSRDQTTRKTICSSLQELRKLDSSLVYAYSTTIHKAQGLGFPSATVDAADILRSSFPDRFKLLYVACTRAEETLHICLE